MKNDDIAIEWFDFAKRDLEAALFLLAMRPIPMEIICYHCQQSAEKYLKGFIIQSGGDIVRTHDLVLLNKLCVNYDEAFVNIEDECIELVNYGVQMRYPYSINIEERDTMSAIKCAQSIERFVLTNKRK